MRSTKKQNLDLHRLVGSLIDDRLRVLRLAHMSPSGWLYEIEPPGVGQTRRALKVLASSAAREPSARARLNLLATRLPSMKISGVEQVFELGWLPDETPYLVTEWCGAVTLHERLRRRGALDWEEAEPLLRSIAEALAELHKAGLTHGDIRAQHVLLPSPRRPLLIDGVVETALSEWSRGGLEQAPAYLAPERARGPSTVASDSYAFGVLAWQVLSGQLPFRGEGEGGDPLEERALQHERAPAPPLDPALCPAPVCALIGELMSKSPGDRPLRFFEIAKRLGGSSSAIVNQPLLPREGEGSATPVTPATPAASEQQSADHDLSPFPTSSPVGGGESLLEWVGQRLSEQIGPLNWRLLIFCGVGVCAGILLAL